MTLLRYLEGNQYVKYRNHPGKEPGFGHSEQEPKDEEAGRARDKGHGRRCDTPGDHDASDPKASARLFENHIARNFEQEIAQKENPRTPAIDIGRETEVLIHAQGREADVSAIHVRNEIDYNDQR